MDILDTILELMKYIEFFKGGRSEYEYNKSKVTLWELKK